MERRSGRNNVGQVPNGPVGGEGADVLRIIQTMLGNQQQQMENQQQQTELLRQELAAPKEQRPGNVSDFRRLQPAIFTGVERPLEAEQWLTDTTDLLNAARVPNENQVEVAKIQLKDIARTWWLAEEASEEVITGNIRVHSHPVLALFDSGASHCYISDNFVAVHSIPCLLYTSPSPRDS